MHICRVHKYCFPAILFFLEIYIIEACLIIYCIYYSSYFFLSSAQMYVLYRTQYSVHREYLIDILISLLIV